MRTDTKYLRHVTAVAVMAVVLAACGNGDAPELNGEEAAGPASVAAAETSLGDVMVDAEGMTLYMFEPDERGPSACVDACAANWPPLIVDGEPVAGDGADPSLLGTVERDDGALQVTYDGWPLYRWVGDGAPGDVTGQGVDDEWWVMAPDGTIVTGAAGDVDDAEQDVEEEDTGSPSY